MSTQLRFCCALHNSVQDDQINICDITSSEALRALRPFYLAVHPDLFAHHPQERSTNEDSLKRLNSYLDALESGCGQGHVTTHALRPKPIHLTFFIRTRASERGMLELIWRVLYLLSENKGYFLMISMQSTVQHTFNLIGLGSEYL